MSKEVLESPLVQLKGSNGEIKLFPDKVRIKRSGVTKWVFGEGLLEIPLNNIIRIEHESPSGFSEGYVRFVSSNDQPHVAGELRKVRQDPNSVTYLANMEQAFAQLKAQILQLGQGQISDQGTPTTLTKLQPKGKELYSLVGWTLFGLLLCLSGIGFVFGLPVIAHNAIKFVRYKERTGACPYCSQQLNVSHDAPQVECKNCDRKLLVRSGMFVHLDDPARFTSELKALQSRKAQGGVGQGLALFVAACLIFAVFAPKKDQTQQASTNGQGQVQQVGSGSYPDKLGDGSIPIERSIPYIKRQQIYIQIIQEAARARQEADRKYPNLSSRAVMKKWSELQTSLETKYQGQLRQKLKLTPAQMDHIFFEGTERRWPRTPDAVRVIAVNPDTGEQSEQLVEAEQAAPDRGDVKGVSAPATVAARRYVKENLVSPASAKFGWGADNIRYEGNGIYWVNGEVESKNAYGVPMKAVYHVKLKHTGGNAFADFKLEDIEILQ